MVAFFLLIFLLFCVPCNADWVDCSLRDTPRAITSTYERCHAIRHYASYKLMTARGQFSDVVRYQNYVTQSSNDKILHYDYFTSADPGNVISQDVRINMLRDWTLLFWDQQSLSVMGNLYVWALLSVEVIVSDGSGFVARVPLAQCYKISNITFDQINLADIAGWNWETVSAENWPYAVWLSTLQATNKFYYTFYRNRNVSGYKGATPIYQLTRQQQNIALQLPQSWLNAWMYGFNSFYSDIQVGASVGSLNGNVFFSFYDQSQSTPFSSNLEGYSTSPNVYLPPEDRSPGNFSGYQNLDWDGGGQYDFSEYVTGNDMRDPSDDNPNMEQTPTDIIAVQPPDLPGENTLYPSETEPIEAPPGEDESDNAVEDATAKLRSALEQNEGYKLLRTLISPEGFPTNSELPRYEIPVNVSVHSFSWDLGTFVIDFNWLRDSPYWSLWAFIRSLCVLCLFIMTFVGCYQIYERALTFSAS